MTSTISPPSKIEFHDLSDELFAPFGQLLRRPLRPADIEKDWLCYWHCLAEIGFKHAPVWGFLEVRQRPRVLSELERHCRSQEVFIPMGGASVMAFATGGSPDDPDAAPDLSSLRLFRLNGSTAFIVNRGVWHTPAFPLTESAGFLLALEDATPEKDLDVRPVGMIHL
ncbi:MAG: ureidoglycolate lyase [bacterium]|nr:ureidoglycolate lyase [Candidatus Sumerlaeota bacterium]